MEFLIFTIHLWGGEKKGSKKNPILWPQIFFVWYFLKLPKNFFPCFFFSFSQVFTTVVCFLAFFKTFRGQERSPFLLFKNCRFCGKKTCPHFFFFIGKKFQFWDPFLAFFFFFSFFWPIFFFLPCQTPNFFHSANTNKKKN